MFSVTVPDDTESELSGCTQFIENYITRYGILNYIYTRYSLLYYRYLIIVSSIYRYGAPHPNFFQGTLEEAVTEACHKPAKDVSSITFSLILFFFFILIELVKTFLFLNSANYWQSICITMAAY